MLIGADAPLAVSTPPQRAAGSAPSVRLFQKSLEVSQKSLETPSSAVSSYDPKLAASADGGSRGGGCSGPATAAGPVDPAAWAVAEKVAAALKEILENEYGMQEHPPVILRPVQMGARRLELFVARETVAEKIGNNKLRGALVECKDNCQTNCTVLRGAN